MPIRRISAELIDEICGSFRTLSVLNLSRNDISQIENLDRLAPCLSKLDLSRNCIASTANGLEALSQLAHLDVSGNRLLSLAGVEHLVSLEVLHASDNLITSVEALRMLSYLPRLHTVTLSGNPIASRPGYREEVAHRLPTLRVLDGQPLNDAPPQATEVVSSAPPSQRPTPQRAQRTAHAAAGTGNAARRGAVERHRRQPRRRLAARRASLGAAEALVAVGAAAAARAADGGATPARGGAAARRGGG